MAVLHLLADGNIGGVEILCKNYLNVSNNNNEVAFLWGLGDIANEIIEDGHSVEWLQTGHFAIGNIVKKVLEICTEKNVKVIVAHHSVAAIHLCLLIIKKKRPDIKMIFYAQSNAKRMCKANHRLLEPIQYIIIRRFYKNADSIICISESVKKSLIETFGNRKNAIYVLHNGIPLEKFKVHEVDYFKVPKIIYIGRLIDEKGVQNTIEALAEISTDYLFEIVGDGPYKRQLEKLVEEKGMSTRVRFLGFRRDIEQLLYESDFFIHIPICEEGFGLTIVEAMAAGLVCIGGNIGAIPEIIEDTKDGYIVKSGNGALVNVISNALNEYAKKNDSGVRENAINKSKKFSMVSYGKQFDLIINQLMGN